jgi:hypothetical protein
MVLSIASNREGLRKICKIEFNTKQPAIITDCTPSTPFDPKFKYYFTRKNVDGICRKNRKKPNVNVVKHSQFNHMLSKNASKWDR